MLRYLYSLGLLVSCLSIILSLALIGCIAATTAAELLVAATIVLALFSPRHVSFSKACKHLLGGMFSLAFFVFCHTYGDGGAAGQAVSQLLVLAVVLTGIFVMCTGLRGIAGKKQ